MRKKTTNIRMKLSSDELHEIQYVHTYSFIKICSNIYMNKKNKTNLVTDYSGVQIPVEFLQLSTGKIPVRRFFFSLQMLKTDDGPVFN